MHFNLKSFALTSMVVAVLSTSAAEGSLRGVSNGIGRQLESGTGPVLTSSGGTNTYGSTSGGTVSTFTAPPKDSCPIKITINSGGGPVGNGPCFDVGAGCAYEIDYNKYAQCNCVQQSPPPPPPRPSDDGPDEKHDPHRHSSDDRSHDGPHHHSSDDSPDRPHPHHHSSDDRSHDGPHHHSSDDSPDKPPPPPPSEWQCFPDPADGRLMD